MRTFPETFPETLHFCLLLVTVAHTVVQFTFLKSKLFCNFRAIIALPEVSYYTLLYKHRKLAISYITNNHLDFSGTDSSYWCVWVLLLILLKWNGKMERELEISNSVIF